MRVRLLRRAKRSPRVQPRKSAKLSLMRSGAQERYRRSVYAGGRMRAATCDAQAVRGEQARQSVM